MNTVIIESKDKNDLKFLIQFAKKLGMQSRELTVEESEDIGLLNAMKKGRKKDYVSKEQVMKKLDSWK